ncbi:MAG: hypothetical protein ACREHC_00845, partial [Candidatus Levyibacteriota bacterium]
SWSASSGSVIPVRSILGSVGSTPIVYHIALSIYCDIDLILIKVTFTRLLSLYKVRNKKDAPSFFDYSAKEKKRIIEKAAQDANKMQKELVEKYDKLYPKEKDMANAYASR